MQRLVLLFSLLGLLLCGDLLAVEKVTFDDDGVSRTVVAKILVEAEDGGLMLQSDDGHIWIVQPEHIQDRASDETPLQPIDGDAMQQQLLSELPKGFKIYRTQHYVIGYNCSEAYVKRVGLLFEQLYRGFFTYWENQRWDLPKPDYPLVALVLADHSSFLQYSHAEIGEAANSLIGYYNLKSNRMTTFNVPNWERNSATIIHEATHQLAYNCGMQTRYADNPMWVSEGLATFFEAPDRRNPNRWQRVGRVNPRKLLDWHKYIRRRPADSLATLLSDDTRYRTRETATDAYAEGWALTYFLIKTHRKEYVKYLRALSESKPLVELTDRERIAMFEQAFNTTLMKLDKKFVAYMRTVRPQK